MNLWRCVTEVSALTLTLRPAEVAAASHAGSSQASSLVLAAVGVGVTVPRRNGTAESGRLLADAAPVV